ncbi:hypothetical protein RSOLAG1IB_02862 [Rhizoctonia solani AG-1 IB]|uniref:Uncharacterized protein n=1 Tax=Thanatephorus cucumeris (strain AG1-IB / isolate 7/3/14) TaxID=1108050 RepID=A0A0B7FPQ3_THACB|nr:hypothetical protein RSOLAG1IB_02862 [Rhizoctonia solani AG-1 IB]
MNSLPSESTPLLPSFHSQKKKTSTVATLSGPQLIFTYIVHVFASLIRLFSPKTTDPILPTVAASPPPAPDIPTSRGTSLSTAEKATSKTVLPKDSSLVVVVRSELPSTTYPTSSLKKAPSCDSILPMKEVRSVRFSAIIDIHEFSRLAGEPVGMVPISKAPGVKIPHIENELRYSREKARLVLELEPVPMKSSYNRKLDNYNDYSSEDRYGSPIY